MARIIVVVWYDKKIKFCFFGRDGVVSIGTFLSSPGCFLYSGIYNSTFRCFPFYSRDVIVIQKKLYVAVGHSCVRDEATMCKERKTMFRVAMEHAHKSDVKKVDDFLPTMM